MKFLKFLISLGISCTKMKNSSSSSTDPSEGHQSSPPSQLDIAELIITLCFLPAKNSLTQFNRFHLIPRVETFLNSLSCHEVPCQKPSSNRERWHPPEWLNFSDHMSTASRRLVTVDLPAVKPCWWEQARQLAIMWLLTVSEISRSRILHGTGVREAYR